MNCKYCDGTCVKKGFYKHRQKYLCKACNKYQRAVYTYKRYEVTKQNQVVLLNKEGMGISSISRILSLPKTTVQRIVYNLSLKIKAPYFAERNQEYEVDEQYTYIGRKAIPCYIVYAINRKTKQVIDFVCGARNKENIRKVIHSILNLSPTKIYTDKLNIFSMLIPPALHRTFQYRTNCIERKNLTLRTHLKRLSRKTICYSKSIAMLEACFRLYVWR